MCDITFCLSLERAAPGLRRHIHLTGGFKSIPGCRPTGCLPTFQPSPRGGPRMADR